MGLPPETFIPALLEALHAIVPSDRNLFDWTDRHGRLIRYYFEGTIDHAINRHYFENFHNQKEADVMPSFKDAVMGHAVVLSAEALDRPEFYRSALYNEVWRPQRLHTRLEAIIRGARGEPLGSLVLYRGPGEKRFTQGDEKVLEAVVPYVARGLQAQTALESPQVYVRSASKRTNIDIGHDGCIKYISADALKMLLLAHGGVTPENASSEPCLDDFPSLTALWKQHIRAAPDAASSASMTVDNPWGRFRFEGCPMRSLGGAPPMLHISIEHFEPQGLSLRRAVDTLCLSPAQKEVCMLIRGAHSQTEIASILGVAPSTVAAHVKHIYSRLEVHSAQELVGLIDRLAGRIVAH